MDLAAHLRATAQHLIWMADMPMARKHAEFRLRELQASHPMYSVLPALIAQLRKERADATPVRRRP